MKIRWLFFMLILVLLSGCISSLHPLYTKDTVTFRNEILGTWVEKDGEEGEWKFEKEKQGDELSYILTYTEKPKGNKKESTSRYTIYLVKLGDYYFMDFEQLLSDEERDKYLASLSPMITTHKFVKVEITREKLILYFFDDSWLMDLFKQQKIRIKHEKLEDDSILLTAPTADLQKFVQKYATEKKAFLDGMELVRKAI